MSFQEGKAPWFMGDRKTWFLVALVMRNQGSLVPWQIGLKGNSGPRCLEAKGNRVQVRFRSLVAQLAIVARYQANKVKRGLGVSVYGLLGFQRNRVLGAKSPWNSIFHAHKAEQVPSCQGFVGALRNRFRVAKVKRGLGAKFAQSPCRKAANTPWSFVGLGPVRDLGSPVHESPRAQGINVPGDSTGQRTRPVGEVRGVFVRSGRRVGSGQGRGGAVKPSSRLEFSLQSAL
jgi:hypothetical protein